MRCLDCGAELRRQAYEGVMVERCGNCGGAWLDWGELGPIIGTQEEGFSDEEVAKTLSEARKPREAAEEKPRRCPVCHLSLDGFEYAVTSGVALDRCPAKCGLWLEGKELEQIQIVMQELEQEYGHLKAGQEAPRPLSTVKHCPRCDEPLRELVYEAVKLDRCASCGGTWCDGDEFHTVIQVQHEAFSEEDFADIRAREEDAKVVAEASVAQQLQCVVCGAELNDVNYQYTSGILIDRCPHGHGIWLDAEELERAQVFAERWEQVDDLAARYQEALAEDKKETMQREQQSLKRLKVSRIGLVNSFMRSLAREGWL